MQQTFHQAGSSKKHLVMQEETDGQSGMPAGKGEVTFPGNVGGSHQDLLKNCEEEEGRKITPGLQSLRAWRMDGTGVG